MEIKPLKEESNFTEEDWKTFNQQLENLTNRMVLFPQETIRRYPRYGELLKDLATNFLLTEILQQENESVKKMIQEGSIQSSIVIIDVIWDIEGYHQRKKKIDDVRKSLMKEMRPPNIETKEEIEVYVREHFDEINPMMQKLRSYGTRRNECGGIIGLCPYAKAFLFVEGATEVTILPLLASKLGFNLDIMQLGLIAIRGGNKGRYHLQLWEGIVREANKQLFILLDLDAKQEAQYLIENNLLPKENCFILEKGTIEDYYPISLIIDALNSEYAVELNQKEKDWLASSNNRIKTIISIIEGRKINLEGRSLKIELGKKVAELITADQIPNEIKALFGRMNQIL